MKHYYILIFLFFTAVTLAQQEKRIADLEYSLEAIAQDAPGLSEKVNVNIKESSLSNFLLAVSEIHKVNINISGSLKQINIVNNFTNVTVGDLLLFLCKEYNLTIDFTGNILSIKPYEAPKEVPPVRIIDVGYDSATDLLTLNLKEDKLYDAFRKIMDTTGKNLVFAPGMENIPLTSYLRNIPFDAAMNQLAYANDLVLSKTRDNFYVFDKSTAQGISSAMDNSGTTIRQARPQRQRKSNFYFTVLDKDAQLLDIDFENIPIASVIYDISMELGVDMFIASPLENAGNATFRAKSITFDALLSKIFESGNSNKEAAPATTKSSQQMSQFDGNAQGLAIPSSGDGYTFKKEGRVYYFGTKGQLSVRNVRTIMLMHRSIELLADPETSQRSVGRTVAPSYGYNASSYNSNSNQLQPQNQNQQSSAKENKAPESIVTIIPDEVKRDLDIKVDKELNSFIVTGPAESLERFEAFVKYIDKPVPVVLIEVMLLEVNRSAIVETGISAGIGDKPVATKGTVFPSADITLGAQTINKIINNFDGFGSLNIGSVVPNFYLSLKAMEANGNLKIRSSPRLSTLNGHKAQLSIGETTYYVVTNQNFYGSQIPQASEIKNYQPIDAELSVTIKPLVSGDGQITLEIKVIQSSFNGDRIDEDAPPGINSREFNSTVRVRDQDMIVLGGLEEKVKNDSGSGVPLLARIPIIKWLFSSRKREDSRKKLTVLIKPTVIY